jgi:hypothetical protein
MHDDSLVQEVREARDAYARSLGYDPQAIVADLDRRDWSGWKIVRLSPRRSTDLVEPPVVLVGPTAVD